MIANAEDEEAHNVCLRLLTKIRGDKGPAFHDGFLDMRCIQSAEKFFGETIFLHRCLQHTRDNAKSACFVKDREGRTRLKKLALVKDIDKWILFSAWLPNEEEFTIYWRHILARLHHNEEIMK